ncbi:MAG: hypothetical protein R3D55_07460 [Chloroflexota bacterium]
MKHQITTLFVLLLLLGCGGGETAVLPTAPSQSPTTFPTHAPAEEQHFEEYGPEFPPLRHPPTRQLRTKRPCRRLPPHRLS